MLEPSPPALPHHIYQRRGELRVPPLVVFLLVPYRVAHTACRAAFSGFLCAWKGSGVRGVRRFGLRLSSLPWPGLSCREGCVLHLGIDGPGAVGASIICPAAAGVSPPVSGGIAVLGYHQAHSRPTLRFLSSMASSRSGYLDQVPESNSSTVPVAEHQDGILGTRNRRTGQVWTTRSRSHVSP